MFFQCSTTCGAGVQQRRVVCRLGHGEIVPNELCLQEKRPRSARRCQDKPCFDYMWKTGPWQNVRADSCCGSCLFDRFSHAISLYFRVLRMLFDTLCVRISLLFGTKNCYTRSMHIMSYQVIFPVGQVARCINLITH